MFKEDLSKLSDDELVDAIRVSGSAAREGAVKELIRRSRQQRRVVREARRRRFGRLLELVYG